MVLGRTSYQRYICIRLASSCVIFQILSYCYWKILFKVIIMLSNKIHWFLHFPQRFFTFTSNVKTSDRWLTLAFFGLVIHIYTFLCFSLFHLEYKSSYLPTHSTEIVDNPQWHYLTFFSFFFAQTHTQKRKDGANIFHIYFAYDSIFLAKSGHLLAVRNLGGQDFW